VRFSNPSNGGDVLPTIRAEMHRLRPGTSTATRREVGSSVWQVFDGAGQIRVASETWHVTRGDLVAVPSWAPLTIRTDSALDLFRFSDAPVFERLHADRCSTEGAPS
jgi:gentisate 1,2-dioxygenase